MLAGVDPSTTPVGEWCDAAWAAYVSYILDASAAGGQPVTEQIDSTWQQMCGEQVYAADQAGPDGTPARPAPPRASSQTPMRFNPETDPETGQPRRPTAAEREAFALQSAALGTNDLLGSARSGSKAGSAERVGG